MEKLTIEKILKKFTTWFNKDRRIVFFTIFLIGMLVHFELYSKEILADDGYWHYGSFIAKGWEISLGRFIIPFIDLFRGTVVVSILTTIISVVVMSFTTLILVDILKVKKTFIKILMGILLIVTPTFSLTLMYTYTADSYTYAMLFSVLTVYFLNKKTNLKNTILAIIFIVLTLGCYQPYICVTVTLCVITYIIQLATNEEITIKELIKKIAKQIVIVALGMVSYYIGFVIITKILHLDITQYSGGNQVLSIETIKNIFPAIKNAYTTFYQFYFTNNIINTTKWHRNVVYLLILFLNIINIILLIINNKTYKTPWKILFITIMIITFPIWTCIIELIAQQRKIELLMAEALYLPIILLLKQIELLKISKINNIVNIISVGGVIILLWTYILSDNATYVAMSLYNKQMYSVGTRIVEKIEENNEITENTPICILGNMKISLKNQELLTLTNVDVEKMTQSVWTWQILLQDNLGLGRTIHTNQTYEEIEQTEEYKQMEAFPKENSIKIINGTAVVKLSN